MTPPATLKARVMSAAREPAPMRQRLPRQGIWMRWSAAAAAAVVLVAAGWFGLRGQAPSATPVSDEVPVVVVEDEGLGLMHALETFDHVGMNRRSDLIAHWGR